MAIDLGWVDIALAFFLALSVMAGLFGFEAAQNPPSPKARKSHYAMSTHPEVDRHQAPSQREHDRARPRRGLRGRLGSAGAERADARGTVQLGGAHKSCGLQPEKKLLDLGASQTAPRRVGEHAPAPRIALIARLPQPACRRAARARARYRWTQAGDWHDGAYIRRPSSMQASRAVSHRTALPRVGPIADARGDAATNFAASLLARFGDHRARRLRSRGRSRLHQREAGDSRVAAGTPAGGIAIAGAPSRRGNSIGRIRGSAAAGSRTPAGIR